MGLASTGRTIREDRAVEAVADGAAQAHRCQLENLLCRGGVVESVIEGIPFLAGAILAQLIFFVLEVLWVPKNHEFFVQNPHYRDLAILDLVFPERPESDCNHDVAGSGAFHIIRPNSFDRLVVLLHSCSILVLICHFYF